MKAVHTARILPLCRPVIDVNSYHAFSQAIVLTNESLSLPWLFSQYIHLFGVPEFDKGNFIHFASSSYFHELPCTFVSKLHLEQVREWFDDPISFFIDCLHKNQYLAIALDEFYIPGTASYQTKKLVHHIMIHGVDVSRQLFYVAGYFSTPPVFDSGREVSFDQLRESFRHAGPIKQRISQTLEIVQYPYQDASTQTFELDLSFVARSLEEYLLSKPLTEKNPKRIHFWFGLRMYDLLEQFLQRELEADQPIIHMKALQTLVNHKRWMVRRMEYLQDRKLIEGGALIEMSKDVLKQTIILHHWCVKQRVKRNPANLVHAIRCARQLKQSEALFLEKCLNILAFSTSVQKVQD